MLAWGAPASAQIAASGNLTATGTHSVIKVKQTDPLPASGMVPIVVKGARGEFVDFQVFIAGAGSPSAPLNGVGVSVSAFSDGRGHAIPVSDIYPFFEFYRTVTQPSGGPASGTGMIPDPLIPLGPDAFYGEARGPGGQTTFNVASGQNQGIWIDVFIPPGTPPGLYNGTVTITDSGDPPLPLSVQLAVWNFTIPPTPSLAMNIQGVAHFSIEKAFLFTNPNGGPFPSNSYFPPIDTAIMQESIRHRMPFRNLGDYVGWSWTGSAVDWNSNTGPFNQGFDQVWGPYYSGSYPAMPSGVMDPYLKTGPKYRTDNSVFISGGLDECGPVARGSKARFGPPGNVTFSTAAAGSGLAAGTWYYMVTSSVTGQGDSSPTYCFGTHESSPTLSGAGTVTLSWTVPSHAGGAVPDAFAIYRSINANARATSLGHGETLIGVVASGPAGSAMTFTDPGIAANPGDPPVHFYNATYHDEFIAFLQQVAQHFSANGWGAPMDYLFDEPHDLYQYNDVSYHAQVFREAFQGQPALGFRNFNTTALPDPWNSIVFKPYQRALVGLLDTWVPNSGCGGITDSYWPNYYRYRQQAGDHVWFYDSDCAADAHAVQPAFFIDNPAISHRIKLWWAFRENYEGYLYYQADLNWADGNNASSPDVWTSNPHFNAPDNGDGTLIYPGRPCPGPNGSYCIGGTHPIPVSSIRMKMTRDSEQDYEYLLLLKNSGAAGAAFAAQEINAVFAAPTLSQSITAGAVSIPLNSAAGMRNPSPSGAQAYPDDIVNINDSPNVVSSFGEMVDFDGINGTTLTQCHYPVGSSCRGEYNSGASSHPQGAAVVAPPYNIVGGSTFDPTPLLTARDAIGCYLDPGGCPQGPSTTPSPLTGFQVQ